MADNWKKKEREKKKQQSKKEKDEKKLERRDNKKDGNDLDSMIMYIDENGNFTSTPPDPSKRKEINAEDINISVPKQAPINPEDLIRKGTVSFFNTSKGYGFINDDETRERVFVHANSLTEMIQENNKVTFEIESSPKGLVAVNVKVIR